MSKKLLQIISELSEFGTIEDISYYEREHQIQIHFSNFYVNDSQLKVIIDKFKRLDILFNYNSDTATNFSITITDNTKSGLGALFE